MKDSISAMNNYNFKDKCRSNLNIYSKKIFLKIPRIDKPNILDVGCGSGVSTIEIASLTNGNILAIDSDKESLSFFERYIKDSNLESNITIKHNSVFDEELRENSFDIITAEGLFNLIGFEKGLTYFSNFLKISGYFIIHDDSKNLSTKLKLIERLKFSVIDTIELDENIWGNLYVNCLKNEISQINKNNLDKINSKNSIKTAKDEIKMFENDPSVFKSTYYLLQKNI